MTGPPPLSCCAGCHDKLSQSRQALPVTTSSASHIALEILHQKNVFQLQVFVRVGGVPRSSGDLSSSESDIQAAPSTSGAGRGLASQHKYSFNIGSIDSFDRKMEEAQEALGFDPNDFIPITYTNELSWSQEALRLLPTLLLIGGYVWFTRRSMGSMGGGGLGGGGRGIFNVGKAQVGTVDKNARDKIMFRVRDLCSIGAMLHAKGCS